MNKKKHRMSLAHKRAITGLLFISPWLIGFLVYYVRSIYMTVQFSLSEVSPSVGGYEAKFVGLKNLKYIFLEHPTFNQQLVLSMKNVFIDVPLIIIFSLLMAMLLNQKFVGRTVVRAVFFLPVIMGSAAITQAIENARSAMVGGVSSTASDIVAASSSSINVDYYLALFKDIGLPSGILDYVVGAVERLADVVSLSGVQIVIFIAALQSIAGSLYEVAKIEGATGYETFWKVTFPMVMPHIITCLVYTVVDSFANSEVVTLSYNEIFSNNHYDYGSAMSLVSTIVVCAVLFIVVAIIQKRTFYYN
ncbi:MAG: sugar ABC transporter permease [Lachnospiraceae bacterium]|nr:sugar ABC transporter permease [Lachnospiraceae bacterium]